MLENIDVSDFFDDFNLDELWDGNPTSEDARYIHKDKKESLKYIINSLQRSIRDYKEGQELKNIEWTTKKALNDCGICTTDTEHEAIAHYVINYLERRNKLLSGKFKAETEALAKFILLKMYGNIPELEYSKLKMMNELKR